MIERMLLWSVDETSGFDAAWVTVSDRRLHAEGRSAGLSANPYWLDYELVTGEDFVHQSITVVARWQDGSATLELQRANDGQWTVDGEARPDLQGAQDCDLAACPLTNTMPVRRHELHRERGDESFLMAFIEVPGLTVVTSRQQYTHLRATDDGGGMVRFRSGSFESDLTLDADGFVVDYPSIGRRVVAAERPDSV